jgi:DNA-binding YbaB/EbfC family protein
MADGPDLGALLQQAQQMQQQLLAAQAQAAEQVHEGTSGGGAVRIEVTGGMEFRSVTIRPDAVDPDDVDMLQDLVLAAINDAVAKVNAAQQDALGGIGGALGGGLGGLLG